MEAIDFWLNQNKRPEKRLTAEYQAKLEKLLDLKPKPDGRGGNEKRELAHLKELMKTTGKQKKKGFAAQQEDDSEESDWETDYDFYIDQYKV